jgi:hypothetical protein
VKARVFRAEEPSGRVVPLDLSILDPAGDGEVGSGSLAVLGRSGLPRSARGPMLRARSPPRASDRTVPFVPPGCVRLLAATEQIALMRNPLLFCQPLSRLSLWACSTACFPRESSRPLRQFWFLLANYWQTWRSQTLCPAASPSVRGPIPIHAQSSSRTTIWGLSRHDRPARGVQLTQQNGVSFYRQAFNTPVPSLNTDSMLVRQPTRSRP